MSDCNTSNGLIKTNPDTSIIYTGPSIPALGICTGQPLSQIESVVLTAILNYSTGIGITIPNINLSSCALFSQWVTGCNQCDELQCLMQIIFTSLCTLYADYTSLQTLVNTLLNGPYNTGCLTLSANPTLNQIIQELILEFCNLVTAFGVLNTTVSGFMTGIDTTIGNFLLNAITSCQGSSCVTKTGIGATASIAFKGFSPIGAIMPFAGPISGRFDTTGLGLTNTDCCGWALCNGQNGTIDMRGYLPVGVNDGTMGNGGQNNEVNNSIYPGQNYSIGSHGGLINVALIAGNNGPHNHAGSNVSSYTYPINFRGFSYRPGDQHDGICLNPSQPTGAMYSPLIVTVPSQPISITTDGAGTPHENRAPYMAVYYIQRIS